MESEHRYRFLLSRRLHAEVVDVGATRTQTSLAWESIAYNHDPTPPPPPCL